VREHRRQLVARGEHDLAQVEPDQAEREPGDQQLDDVPQRGLGEPLGGLVGVGPGAQLQREHDDGDHPGGAELVGGQVGGERQDQGERAAPGGVGEPAEHPARQPGHTQSDEDRAGGAEHEPQAPARAGSARRRRRSPAPRPGTRPARWRR
jgi:hypothetical protein